MKRLRTVNRRGRQAEQRAADKLAASADTAASAEAERPAQSASKG
jgi:hypothetical protein